MPEGSLALSSELSIPVARHKSIAAAARNCHYYCVLLASHQTARQRAFSSARFARHRRRERRELQPAALAILSMNLRPMPLMLLRARPRTPMSSALREQPRCSVLLSQPRAQTNGPDAAQVPAQCPCCGSVLGLRCRVCKESRAPWLLCSPTAQGPSARAIGADSMSRRSRQENGSRVAAVLPSSRARLVPLMPWRIRHRSAMCRTRKENGQQGTARSLRSGLSPNGPERYTRATLRP